MIADFHGPTGARALSHDGSAVRNRDLVYHARTPSHSSTPYLAPDNGLRDAGPHPAPQVVLQGPVTAR